MNFDSWHLCITPRVLLVIEEPFLAEQIRLALSHGSYTLRVTPKRVDVTDTLLEWRPDIVITDLDVANDAVLDDVSMPAPSSARIPIVALTRRGDLHTKLSAFAQGVDDILTIPFSPQELVARIMAVLRRTYCTGGTSTSVLRRGELEIDILHRSVRVGGHALHLTSLDQSLLYLLAANAGRILSRNEILDHLWGVDFAAESNVVDRHVRSLRAKLQDDWQRPRYIATVPGHGYCFLLAAAEPSTRPTPGDGLLP